MHEPFNPHFLVGNNPSYTNPCPITPNFYSYPFPIYETPLGLTSLWYSFSPCIACLLLPRGFFLFFFFQRYFSGSIPNCLEVICSAAQSLGLQSPQTVFPHFQPSFLLSIILRNGLTDMASSQPPITVNLCDCNGHG